MFCITLLYGFPYNYCWHYAYRNFVYCSMGCHILDTAQNKISSHMLVTSHVRGVKWDRHTPPRSRPKAHVGKSSESVQCAITGPYLRMRHRPSAERTVPIRKIWPHVDLYNSCKISTCDSGFRYQCCIRPSQRQSDLSALKFHIPSKSCICLDSDSRGYSMPRPRPLDLQSTNWPICITEILIQIHANTITYIIYAALINFKILTTTTPNTALHFRRNQLCLHCLFTFKVPVVTNK